MNSLRSIQQT